MCFFLLVMHRIFLVSRQKTVFQPIKPLFRPFSQTSRGKWHIIIIIIIFTLGTQLFIEKRILYDTHVPISTAERTILTVGSAFAALNNPLRGDMVATLGETTGNVFLSRMRDGMLQSEEGRQILRERPMISTSTIDFDRLKKECSPDSFGMAYISWLEAQGVTPDTRSDVSSCYIHYNFSYLSFFFRLDSWIVKSWLM